MLDILIIRPEFSALRQMGCLDLGVIILTKPTAISHALIQPGICLLAPPGLLLAIRGLLKNPPLPWASRLLCFIRVAFYEKI